ncbi:MAG: CoA-binding protein [Candidatus Polarisedimenticolaceae bacterium]|nr:CoA-binding protein [Candidatus Polarisedimenticolaceae bacterium]
MSDDANCELPDSNPPSEEIATLLSESKVTAIVGLSDKPDRSSNRVARYLKRHGYKIIPVNPLKDEILGEKCYPSLAEVPEPVDIVTIFRKIDAVPAIVEEAIKISAKAIWLQLGLAHHRSAEKARQAGLIVVQSKCMEIEHKRLQ